MSTHFQNSEQTFYLQQVFDCVNPCKHSNLLAWKQVYKFVANSAVCKLDKCARVNQVQIWSLDLQLVCPRTNFVQT